MRQRGVRCNLWPSAPSTKTDTEKVLREATYGINRKSYSNIEEKEIREVFQEKAEIEREHK